MQFGEILKYEIIEQDGLIVLETDEEERDLKKLEELNIKIIDIRKYGRVRLIFLKMQDG